MTSVLSSKASKNTSPIKNIGSKRSSGLQTYKTDGVSNFIITNYCRDFKNETQGKKKFFNRRT